jgi:hypothetical protein
VNKLSRIAFALSLFTGAVTAPAWAGTVQAATADKPNKNIDPQADQALKRMTDYLAGLKSFIVESSAVDEQALTSGQKIQRTSDSEITLQRPNRVRSLQRGAGKGVGVWYDGTAMTITCKANDKHSTLPAPPTLDAAIDSMRKEFQIDAPGADLLYSNPYDILMEQVKSGRVVGTETINGVAAKHLAFEGEDIDWQIWIQDGTQPLPLRFVITTKTVKSHPQFAVQFSKWQTQVDLPPAMFSFPQSATGDTSGVNAKTIASSCVPSA